MTKPHQDTSSEFEGFSSADSPTENLPIQEDSTEQYSTDELAEGYEYVHPDGTTTGSPVEEDDSLSHQLFLNGTVVEKRSLADRLQDRKESQAQQRAEKEERERQEQAAKIAAGIAAVRASRTDEGVVSSVASEEEKRSHRGLWVLGASAFLVLLGGGSLLALGSMNNDPQPMAVPAESSSSAASSTSATPSSAKPSATQTVAAPEVKYVEQTTVPVAPGQVDYVEDPATQATEPSVPAPVQTPVAPVAPPVTAAPSAATAEQPSVEPTTEDPTSAAPTTPATQPPATQAPAPSAAPQTVAPVPTVAPASPKEQTGALQQTSAANIQQMPAPTN